MSRYSIAVRFLKQNWQHTNHHQQRKHSHFEVAILKRILWKRIAYPKYTMTLDLSQVGQKAKKFFEVSYQCILLNETDAL